MSTTGTCPNCNTTLKDSVFNSVKLIPEEKTRLLNEYSGQKAEAYCTKCGPQYYDTSIDKFNHEIGTVRANIQELLGFIPVITIQNPYDWRYEVVGMVTGQSVTGTGVLAEFTSSFTDLFGMQSGRYNQKLKAGEQLCTAQLRKQALDMGANAVIATDIDYSEVGGDKGMLMVCMSGTAVTVTNYDVLGEERIEALNKLAELNARERYLDTIHPLTNYN